MTSVEFGKVIEAAKDYKYLLSRRYPQKQSLDLVSSRYGLSRLERLLLYRCVHSDEMCKFIMSKTVNARDICGSELIIDGYNVLLTVLTGIKGEPLYLCDDGFVRDLRGAQPRDEELDLIRLALQHIRNSLRELRPMTVVFVLDSSVSKSRQHSYMIQEIVKSNEFELSVVLAKKADKYVIMSKGIAASSDIVVLQNAHKVFDLAQYTIRRLQDQGYRITLYQLKI